MPRISAKIAVEAEDLARRYAEAERATLEKFRKELPNLKRADAGGRWRNSS